jgi:hypothetical protein
MGAHLLERLHAIASLKELVATCAQTGFDNGTIDVRIVNDQYGGTRGLHATSLRTCSIAVYAKTYRQWPAIS